MVTLYFLHIHIKPQNRNKVFVLFLLGGIWGMIDHAGGIMQFFIDGILIALISIGLGNLTAYLLSKLGVNIFKSKEIESDLLDDLPKEKTLKEIENDKDQSSLKYGIMWVVLFILFTLF